MQDLRLKKCENGLYLSSKNIAKGKIIGRIAGLGRARHSRYSYICKLKFTNSNINNFEIICQNNVHYFLH